MDRTTSGIRLRQFRSGWLLLALASAGVTQSGPRWEARQWQTLHERAGVSLRALAPIDGTTIWAGGSAGTLLRSRDGGQSWHDVAPRDTANCDFRDLHAFDADTAVAMVAGQPARIYRTADGGASWTVVHSESDPSAFFDSIEFDGRRGFLFGDPLSGSFYVLRSDDAGASWRRLDALPPPLGEEAGFAASGSCISVAGDVVRIATGGGASRCLSSHDGGRSWQAVKLPLQQGAPSQGAFSMTFVGEHGVAVGGDYRVPEQVEGTAAWTDDGGRSWQPSAAGAGGYRSAAVWLDATTVLAVGERGASLSHDRGRSWQGFGEQGFHVVARAADGTVFAAGSEGRIARLDASPDREFAVMRLFGDHMVLPPEQVVAIRGFGPPGAGVEVGCSWGKDAAATIQADGRWRCDLPTPTRGGPHSVTLRCENVATEIVLRDVLIGDVWLCSGQSNMEMPIGNAGGWRGGIDNAEAEIRNADHPGLRVFTVSQRASGTPLDDVEGEWQVCSPATAAGFSASAYFFARELLQHGHGPIGLVVSSWGGTVCEAWTSPAALAEFPEFGAALAATREPTRPRDAEVAEFWRAVPAQPDDGEWQGVALPGLWSNDGFGDFDGVAFYRRRVALPDALRGVALLLELGAIDDMDTVWCNAVRVGGMEDDGAWATPRRYTVPAAATADREALDIVVRVVDTGGEGGFSGDAAAMRLRVSEGDAGGEGGTVALAGPWWRQRGPGLGELPSWPRRAGNSPNRPAVLYNAMIAPLQPFPFCGAIWYQGESNRGRAEQYARLFPAMIRDWRAQFAVPLPFYFVQIAPFGYGNESRHETAELRQAQAAALALPETGMVVTLDIGDARDIHPRNKQEVGRRLALHALRQVYGHADLVADGPTPTGVVADRGELRITFANAAGLTADTPLGGFEIAAADDQFVAANARIDGATVVVGHDSIAAPRHVRHAWAAAPTASLRNGDGLPAAPFRISLPVGGGR